MRTSQAWQPVSLASLRCGCGSAEVMTVAPGSDDDRPGDLFLVARGVPVRGWCIACCTRLMERAA